MGASYPSNIKTFSTLVDDVDDVLALHQNERGDEITAIETELGTNPKGNASDLKTRLALADTGWIPVSDTWTYASATTINVPTGAGSIYQKGWRIRFKQGGGYKYVVVVGVADTLLTVTGGSDYSVANAAITDIYYSFANGPFGSPEVFNYVPTGISATNVSLSGRFAVSGKICRVDMQILFTGGITFTTMPTLPIQASANQVGSIYYGGCGGGGYYHGSGNAYTLIPGVAANSLVVNIARASDMASLSATIPVTWANGDGILLNFSYQI